MATEQPRPRTAYYEAADHQPAMPRRLWYRLCALQRHRGQLADECAWRMIAHLTHRADARGRLADVPGIMRSYASVHRVGIRTAWSDFRRVRTLGYVRQTVAAAPGRAARYVLSVPPELPAELPASLARAVRREIDPPSAQATGAITRAEADRLQAECETVRHGSATGPAIRRQSGCGRLHTSPYTREGSPPSPRDHARDRLQGIPGIPQKGGITDEEKRNALYTVKTCGPHWAWQREDRGLSAVQVAEVLPLVALLLRHVPQSEAVELMTERTRSAADLPGVIRYRIGRVLAAARRRSKVRADEDGRGYAAAMTARAEAAAQRFEETQAGRSAFAAARAAMEAAHRSRASAPGPAPGAARRRPAAVEPEEVFHASLPVDSGVSRPAEADRAWLVDATAAIRAQHRRTLLP
ncbi:hypothetical protein [Planomonospora sp. ID82291]|uniref:hypothetical protein n=1 Tax=Planomonospora sp. ID82291 TaxID=2738136 RepID=UPI0018C40F77|nr:hypothetical protein [Planomonospora sp. ID82291]MBG0819125.1 hypothetical protein [Planomonospora sp. ID82291]